MKIGIVVPGGVDRSGVDRVIPALLDLIERLAARHEVHVFALYQEKVSCQYWLRGANVHCIARGRPMSSCLLAIVRENSARSFDVFHGFWLIPGGLIAGFAAGLLGAKSVVHVAGGELVDMPDINFGVRRSWRGRILTTLSMLMADRLTAASKPIARDVARFGFSTTLVPLGVDVRKWRTRSGAGHAARASHGKRILAVGSINGVKDYETLLRAFVEFSRHLTEWTLKIIGEDVLSGRVQALARELDLGDSVTFHGFARHDRVAELMGESDMLVISSRHEAGPVCAVEAAAAGLPVVGTAVGHLSDWAEMGVETAPTRDWMALGRAMVKTADNARATVPVVTRLFEWASFYDADWTATTFESIYRGA